MKTKVVKWLKVLIKKHCQSKGYSSMRGNRLEWKVGYIKEIWQGDMLWSYEDMADYILEYKKGVFDIHTTYIKDDVNFDLLFDENQAFNLDEILEAK